MPYGLTYKNINDLSVLLAIRFKLPVDEVKEFIGGTITRNEVNRIARNEIREEKK